jgi:hypothetical protein
VVAASCLSGISLDGWKDFTSEPVGVAPTPAEIRCVLDELDLTIAWNDLAIRDRGRLAHLRDQNPGIDN